MDGTGESDIGRVTFSDGGNGYSCAICNHSTKDIFRTTSRTPCPGSYAPSVSLAPTLAGGPIAAAIAAYGLLQTQRAVTGNDREHVVDREIIVDMSHGQVLSLMRRRSEKCLSRHVRWCFRRVARRSSELSLGELFDLAAIELGTKELSIEPYGHPLCLESICDRGHPALALGTRFSPLPKCTTCEANRTWLRHSALTHLTREITQHLEINDHTLAALGMPARGGLFTATSHHKPQRSIRFLLD